MSRKKPIPYTREELIQYLLDLNEKLGRRPKKSDVQGMMHSYYRSVFGKWIYALEASGLSVPSAATLARRNRHKSRNVRNRKKRAAIQETERADTQDPPEHPMQPK